MDAVLPEWQRREARSTAGRLEEVANTVITVATTAISIYTGFKGLMGGD